MIDNNVRVVGSCPSERGKLAKGTPLRKKLTVSDVVACAATGAAKLAAQIRPTSTVADLKNDMLAPSVIAGCSIARLFCSPAHSNCGECIRSQQACQW